MSYKPTYDTTYKPGRIYLRLFGVWITPHKPRRGTPEKPYKRVPRFCPKCKAHTSLGSILYDEKVRKFYGCPACDFRLYFEKW